VGKDLPSEILKGSAKAALGLFAFFLCELVGRA
jgi:hypothetical protein